MSVRRRILNLVVDELVHKHSRKKNARTYRRELEESEDFYPSKILL